MHKEEIKLKFLRDHNIAYFEENGNVFYQDEDGNLINISKTTLKETIEICGYGQGEIDQGI